MTFDDETDLTDLCTALRCRALSRHPGLRCLTPDEWEDVLQDAVVGALDVDDTTAYPEMLRTVIERGYAVVLEAKKARALETVLAEDPDLLSDRIACGPQSAPDQSPGGHLPRDVDPRFLSYYATSYKALYELYSAGCTTAEIADQMSLPRASIAKMLWRMRQYWYDYTVETHAMQHVMEELTGLDRSVATSYCAGVPQRQAADRMGISLGAYRVHLCHARRHARQWIDTHSKRTPKT